MEEKNRRKQVRILRFASIFGSDLYTLFWENRIREIEYMCMRIRLQHETGFCFSNFVPIDARSKYYR